MARNKTSKNKTSFKNPKGTAKKANSTAGRLGDSAEVIDVILDPRHPEYNPERWPGRKIGDIQARPASSFNLPISECQWYHPMWPNIFAGIPLIGEIVLLVEAMGQSNRGGTSRLEKYYLPAVNTWHDPNHNQVPAATFDINMLSETPSEAEICNPSGVYTANNGTEQGAIDLTPPLGRIFQTMDIKRLQPYEGDVMFEGRFGQSIRFGSTNKTGASPNLWSSGEGNNDPIFILSNGHRTAVDQNYHIEDPDQDGSSLWICGGNAITFNPPSDNWDSYKTTFDAEALSEIPNELYKQVPAPPEFEGERPGPSATTPEEVLIEQKEASKATSEEKKQDLDKPCPDGQEQDSQGKCVDKEVAEDDPVDPPSNTNEHTCGLATPWNKKIASILAPLVLDKQYSDLGWMSGFRNSRPGKTNGDDKFLTKYGVPHPRLKEGEYNNTLAKRGGETWVGILHWTGCSIRTLYEAMDEYVFPPNAGGLAGKTMIEAVFPKSVKIEAYKSGPGMFYNGKNAGKTLRITKDVLVEFSCNADTKELNYDWWFKGMREFVNLDQYSREVQSNAVWKKFGTKVSELIPKFGAKTAREYAIMMCGLNSAPAFMNKNAEKANWNIERLMQIYCSGDWGKVSPCRGRCNKVNRYYPACKDQWDPSSKYYRDGYVYGGCKKVKKNGKKVGYEHEAKQGMYLRGADSIPPPEGKAVYKAASEGRYGREDNMS